jgi:RNA polymerase sigma-70 factor (ECF subfamily)
VRTDEELFELCRERDGRAWETLIQRHQDRVLNLAYQFTGNREQARDLAQEIFVRLYQTMESFQSGRSFRVWLYSVGRNLCIDHYRRERRERRRDERPVDEIRDLASPLETPEQNLAKREREALLFRALDGLGSISREAIVMKDLQNLSLDEIARTLEVPLGTVKSRLARARLELGKSILRLERGSGLRAGEMRGVGDAL